MNDFLIYFEYGFEHICDIAGLDHILFIAALCLRFQFPEWRKILILVTAFTIGHSITLAVSAFNLLNYSTKWVEFIIPVTILVTALSNVFVKKFVFKTKFPAIYFFALFFGLVHGLGFSSRFKSLMGRDQNVVPQLLPFNLGLELGQLLIVTVILLISFIFVSILKCNRREYLLYVSGGIFALALEMALQRWPMAA